jgi:hypothetical protein
MMELKGKEEVYETTPAHKNTEREERGMPTYTTQTRDEMKRRIFLPSCWLL